jgi:thiol-disulfide isomerase/thioredoxin
MRPRLRQSTQQMTTCVAVVAWALAVPGGLLAVAAAVAAGADAGITAAGIQLGGHVAGPMLTPASLAHRVVLLEFWGVSCPPCIRSMPLLEDLHREFGPRGLVVVGAHAQGGSAAELQPKVKDLGVSFTIVEQGSVEGGMDFQGIPHCMLFDHTGACVYRGSPFDVGEAVTRAVAAAPAGVLEGRQLVKLAAVGASLMDERSFGTALKKAEGLASAKDADTAAEAKYVVEKLSARGRTMLEEADGLRESDPVRAADLVQRCSVCFKGTAIGSDAAARLREWRKDKAFQAALRAGQQLAALEAVQAAAAQAGGLPPALVGKVRSLVTAIRQAAPDSHVADQAATIAGELGVTVAGP